MAEVRYDFILEQSDDHCSFHAIVVRLRSRPLDRCWVANEASLSRLSLTSHTSLPENLGEHGKPLDQLFLQQASTVLLNLLHASLALHQYGHCSYWSCRSCSYVYHTDLEVM